jgi:hypothetical protein
MDAINKFSNVQFKKIKHGLQNWNAVKKREEGNKKKS